MNLRITAALSLCIATTAPAVSASSLGACEFTGVLELSVGSRIEWEFDPGERINNASLRRNRDFIHGDVVNVRTHDDGTPDGQKINLLFESVGGYDVLEIIIMRRSVGASAGAVAYIIVDEEWFADVIVPFSSATCVIRR